MTQPAPSKVAPKGNGARKTTPVPHPAAKPAARADGTRRADHARTCAQDWGDESHVQTVLPDVLDRGFHAGIAHLTSGLSPIGLADAYFDWALHLAFSPGKQMQLSLKALRKLSRFSRYAFRSALDPKNTPPCIEPLPQDRRFASEAWRQWPFNLMYQSFLLTQQWWHNATSEVNGVTRQHERVTEFAARQILDIFSPSNFLLTNPEVLKATAEQGGANLLRGFENLLNDWERAAGGKKPAGADAFEPGKEVAVTPGKIIYRNDLIELIQYAPATDKVYPQPILIVPAWIMKYYILDLSPKNSLVRYLTGQGFTVFMISWRNPGPDDRNLSLDDYRNLGVMAALDAVSAIVPGQKIHAAGYCLGGTLLSIAAAAMARDRDARLGTLTFLAAQTDFEEAGELLLFINDSQVAFLEDLMWEQGFLATYQMAGAFQMLRSNDLVWSRLVQDYLKGERRAMTDLMAWNADATRMPYRMQSEYLRKLFLNNDLAEGRYHVNGRPITLSSIREPIFCVGTVWDHVAPWQSVYRLRILTETEFTFVLTTGGHNAGIVSEPGHEGRSYRIATMPRDEAYADADKWAAGTPVHDGSWWPAWTEWLSARSGAKVSPPQMGAPEIGYAPMTAAPGEFVLQP